MRHKQYHVRQVTAASRRGAVLVLIAILLPVMLLLSAIAINYCYMDLCRTELYTAVDAAT
jgi:Flp pilus assembly protein TadG